MKNLLVALLLCFAVAAQAQSQIHGKVLSTSQLIIYDTTIHITSAQIKADSATPVTLIPAQGAGTIINPLLVLTTTKHTDATAYTVTGGPIIYASIGTYGIANGAQVNDAAELQNDLTSTSGGTLGALTFGNSGGQTNSPFSGLIGGSFPVTDSLVNKPLILSTSAAFGGPGTATLDVEVIYTVHQQ